MKASIRLRASLFLLLFASCAPVRHYQVFETASEDLYKMNRKLVTEDDYLHLEFYFWDRRGSTSFLARNLTEHDIFIDLGRSHLVTNGIAETYYRGRMFSQSGSSVISKGSGVQWPLKTGGSQYHSATVATVSTSEGLAWQEERIVCIPPGSAKYFGGYMLNETLFVSCDMKERPGRRDVVSLNFGKDDSPLIYTNIVSYRLTADESADPRVLQASFWVSSITNYPENMFYERMFPERCGIRSYEAVEVEALKDPSKFYIRY